MKEQEIKQLEETITKTEGLILQPTYDMIKDHIRHSNIDRRKWSEDYNCMDFSVDLMQEFREEKIYGCIAELVFEDDTAHAINVFKTEKGITTYVEPQDDMIIQGLKEGQDYCEVVDWDCEWTIKKIKHCWK